MPALKFDRFLKKSTMPASGLVEILIAMTIFAVAIITITSLNAKNFKVIKDNELTDQSNKIMISSLEFFKSPAQSVQDLIAPAGALPPLDTTYSYWLTGSANYINPALPSSDIQPGDWSRNAASPFIQTTPCTKTTTQRVYLGSNSPDSFLLCLQVDVVRKSAGFLVTSKIIYYVNGAPKFNSIIGFRPYTYLNVTPTP